MNLFETAQAVSIVGEQMEAILDKGWMKRTWTVLLAGSVLAGSVLAVSVLAVSVLADGLLAYEDFGYETGVNLAASAGATEYAGGSGWATGWTNQTAIETGALVLGGNLHYRDATDNLLETAGRSVVAWGNGGSVVLGRLLENPPAAVAGTSVYVSFLARNIGEAADPNDPDWATLKLRLATPYPGAAGVRIADTGSTGTNAILGRPTDGVVADVTQIRPFQSWKVSAQDLKVLDSQIDDRASALVVVRFDYYDAGSGKTGTTVTLYVNPVLAAEAGNPNWSATILSSGQPYALGGTHFGTVGLRADTGSTVAPPARMQFDELRIGSDWAAVTPHAPADFDGDGTPDALDPDDDDDTIPDVDDLDDDNDGLSDADEALIGTDPRNVDFDGDGVADGADAFPLNPLESGDNDHDGIGDNADPDDDNDTLSDIEEAALGTNPLKADTDDDLVPDNEDTFPLNPDEQYDTDGDGIGNNADLDDDADGLSDEEEAALGTNPLLADTDDDGLRDGIDARPLVRPPAFPGADGAGAHATGGRGGVVYHVTSLTGEIDANRSNTPGTLPYGLNDGNFRVDGIVQPRTIVFDVGGTIWLAQTASTNDIGWDSSTPISTGTHLTIAGATAPGGINISGGGLKANGYNGIIRDLVIAPGYGGRNWNPETPGDFPDSFVYDAINVSGERIIIDHVTTIFATDETLSVDERGRDVTIQFCNISLGQNYPQADAEASGVKYTGHALGSLIQPGSGAAISFLSNLYAHQKGRLPRVGTEVSKLTDPNLGGYNDFRNNVIYNWLGTAGTGAGGQPSQNNFVANFYLAGAGGENPVGGTSTELTYSSGGTSVFSGQDSTRTKVYHSGNAKDINKDNDPEDWITLTNSDFTSSTYMAEPFAQVPFRGLTLPAADAFDRVLAYVGANWEQRGPIDARVVNETRTVTGQITAWFDPWHGTEWNELMNLRSAATHGGLGGTGIYVRPIEHDPDRDGMPGHWEEAIGRDPATPEFNGDIDQDNYTDLEEYLNAFAAFPAPSVLSFNKASGRYEDFDNWSYDWQPSRLDDVLLASCAVTIAYPGQYAGTLILDGAEGTSLNVSDGWLHVAGDAWVGQAAAGALQIAGGTVRIENSLTIGNGGGVDLTGGILWAKTIDASSSPAGFHVTGGTLHVGKFLGNLNMTAGRLAPGTDEFPEKIAGALGDRSPVTRVEDPVGITHVTGDLDLGANSVLQVDLASSMHSDKIEVTGALTVGGALEVGLVDGYVPDPGTLWVIASAPTITGGFSAIPDGYQAYIVGDALILQYGVSLKIAQVASSWYLQVIAQQGVTYQAKASSNLSEWNQYTTFDGTGQVQLIDIPAPAATPAFYQVIPGDLPGLTSGP